MNTVFGELLPVEVGEASVTLLAYVIPSSLVSFNVIFYDEPTKNILVGLLDENLTEFFRLWFYNIHSYNI